MSFYNDPMFVYSGADRSNNYDTTSNTINTTLEIKNRKSNELINKLSDENAKLWQEVNDAKYAISLLEKQMAGLRAKVAKIETKNTFDRPPEYTAN